MKYRTIIDRFGDETVGDMIIKRDLHNRWMVYGTIEHSNLNRSIAVPVGCGDVLQAADIQVMAKLLSVDRNYIKVIDSENRVFDICREGKLLLCEGDGFT